MHEFQAHFLVRFFQLFSGSWVFMWHILWSHHDLKLRFYKNWYLSMWIKFSNFKTVQSKSLRIALELHHTKRFQKNDCLNFPSRYLLRATIADTFSTEVFPLHWSRSSGLLSFTRFSTSLDPGWIMYGSGSIKMFFSWTSAKKSTFMNLKPPLQIVSQR